jgi:hypothetical protein
MTTQTLRGMSTHGPMHWRGDRTGGYVEPNVQPNSGAFNEDLAFKAFKPAFEGLVGRDDELSDPDMQAFTNFILEVTLPPNPIRELDNSLSPAATLGHSFFIGPTSDTVANCEGCHRLNHASGFFGADGRFTFENETQDFKVAHLRNLYQKIGMFGMPAVDFFNSGDNSHKSDQIRGFGFLHDGSTDTLFRFHQATVFNSGFNANGGDPTRRNVEAFMFAFDSDLYPIVGQQTTLSNGPDNNNGVVGARITLLIARATAGECDLIVKGIVAGENRGYVYRTADSMFHSDRALDSPINDGDLRLVAAAGNQPLTYTCVPPGSGDRAGIDRDEDTYLDSDEIDAGSDPADPGSIPGVPTATPTQTPTSTQTPTMTPTQPTSQCGSTPPPVCKAPGKSKLVIRGIAGKEAVQFKWLNGEQTDPGEIGNPATGGTDFSLCMYSGVSPSLIMDVGPIVQAACGTAPCFKTTASGYRYKDTTAGNEGVHVMVLKAGTAGKAKMIVKAKGGNVPLPNMSPSGLTLPVQVVLQNDQGECWSATYTTPIRNDSSLFKAK